MNIVTQLDEWRLLRRSLAADIGFIPTMGNLHAGHLSLCAQSQKQNALTVVSIFVNPTQFNQPEDFACYPRTLADDIAQLTAMKVDYVLVPSATDMYPDNYEIQLTESLLSNALEGAHRPLHFTGMLTVVLKLLNLVRPTRAYFGEKDYQQYLLISKMAKALFLETEIVSCKTIRAHDDLALSSRNQHLNSVERELAKHFPRLLRSSNNLTQIKLNLEQVGFQVDYVAEEWGRRLGAVRLGKVRLIDNLPLNEIE